MLIKSLQQKVYNVNLAEVYIKPFYNGDIVKNYAICSNERNNEVVLAEYSDRIIANHMVHLLQLYENMSFPVDMLTEIRLAEDLWLAANCRLNNAKESYTGGHNNEKLYRR